jgi:ABC-type glycerol-3-phosphate transport system substrate-binding protein
MKKMLSLFLMSLLTIAILGACGQDTKDVSIDSEKKETTEKTSDTNKSESKEKKEETKSKLGSRTNPVPFKTTATVEDELISDSGDSFPIKINITVMEVIRGDAAFQKLKAMNEFNENAPEGYEWVLAKTKVKLTESETEDLAFFIDGVMNFSMVSESGDIYSGDIVGTTEPDFSFEMYVGNEKEGYISGLVKTGEKAQLRYADMMDGQVFFNMQ